MRGGRLVGSNQGQSFACFAIQKLPSCANQTIACFGNTIGLRKFACAVVLGRLLAC